MREFLNCALKEVMTDELVNSFTWPGGKTSAKLGDTKVANVLYRKCLKIDVTVQLFFMTHKNTNKRSLFFSRSEEVSPV